VVLLSSALFRLCGIAFVAFHDDHHVVAKGAGKQDLLEGEIALRAVCYES
jgi:hypothetical protein